MMCNHPSIWIRACLFTVALAGNLPISAQEAAGIELPDGKRKPVGPYSRLVAELDAATQESSTEIIEIAKELGDEFALRLAKLELAGTGPPPGQLLETVQILGEVSSRLEAAEHWAEFTLRDERIRHAAAKRHVKARNAAELRRAYAEYQWQLLARQVAAHDLWRLATGRARVMAVETYSNSYTSHSTTRSATRAETLQFANNLRRKAYARIHVVPPRRTRLVDVYDIGQLAARAEQRAAIKRLSNQVDDELKRLAPRHLELVTRAMHGSERKQQGALLSLGWWNDLQGHRLLEDSFRSESRLCRAAAVVALGRLRLDSLTLKAFARHERPEVRLEVARLAALHVQDIPKAMDAIRELYLDKDPNVRAESYSTLGQFGSLENRGFLRQLPFVKRPLNSTSPEIVVDAVDWLADCGDNTDQRLIQAKLSLLHPLQRHYDDTIRTAASNARNALYVARN